VKSPFNIKVYTVCVPGAAQLFSLLHLKFLFENRVLRGIFGPKRDEITGECRKLHSEELHVLY
jgi:hypothetical protein